MVNTLASPTDLADFPGAPFTEAVVDAAVATLRLEAGWHIAPQVTETVTVNAGGGTDLILPTLHLVNVTEVREVSGSTPVVLTGWRQSRIGILTRNAGWPRGLEVIEVDMVHGHTETPPELLSVIAYFGQRQKSDPTVSQESLGSWSRTLRTPSPSTETATFPLSTLGHFTIRRGFG
jgi:hypothetical protein